MVRYSETLKKKKIQTKQKRPSDLKIEVVILENIFGNLNNFEKKLEAVNERTLNLKRQ